MRLSSLFWLVLVVAICVAWWKDANRQSQQIEWLEREIEALKQPTVVHIY